MSFKPFNWTIHPLSWPLFWGVTKWLMHSPLIQQLAVRRLQITRRWFDHIVQILQPIKILNQLRLSALHSCVLLHPRVNWLECGGQGQTQNFLARVARGRYLVCARGFAQSPLHPCSVFLLETRQHNCSQIASLPLVMFWSSPLIIANQWQHGHTLHIAWKNKHTSF